MEWLKSQYPLIHETIKAAIPDYWPALQEVFQQLISRHFPESALTIASCKAVEGNPKDAVEATAAFITLGYGVRIFDDLFDKDKDGLLEEIGPERTWNMASTVQNIAYAIVNNSSVESSKKQKLFQCLIDAFFVVAAGQDRDIAGNTLTEEEYWLTVELKSAYIYASACELGAIVGTDDTDYITSCRTFGRHLGRSLQIINDMESIWQFKGKSDIEQNKVTLPVLYGLSVDHPAKTELVGIVEQNLLAEKSARVVEILNSIDTKTYLYWAALKEREEALDALSVCPDNEGKEALEAYITGMFGDIESLHEASKA